MYLLCANFNDAFVGYDRLALMQASAHWMTSLLTHAEERPYSLTGAGNSPFRMDS